MLWSLSLKRGSEGVNYYRRRRACENGKRRTSKEKPCPLKTKDETRTGTERIRAQNPQPKPKPNQAKPSQATPKQPQTKSNPTKKNIKPARNESNRKRKQKRNIHGIQSGTQQNEQAPHQNQTTPNHTNRKQEETNRNGTERERNGSEPVRNEEKAYQTRQAVARLFIARLGHATKKHTHTQVKKKGK